MKTIPPNQIKRYPFHKTLFAGIILLLLNLSTFAWNARGHMLTAAIAFEQMSASSKDFTTMILTHHPAYAPQWKVDYEAFSDQIPLGKYLMMRASVWPDEIRSSKNPDHSLNRPKWHYITYKIDFLNGHDTSAIDGKKEPNVVWATHYCIEIIKDPSKSLEVRAVHLAWLLHLIGDMHQPLHCGSLFNSDYPEGDRGGNDFFVTPKDKGINLHKMWDDALGKGDKKNVISIVNQGNALIESNHKVSKKLKKEKIDPRKWSLESFVYAVEEVHLNGNLKGSTNKDNSPNLPEKYTKMLKKLSELQCYKSGVRMGLTLNDIFR